MMVCIRAWHDLGSDRPIGMAGVGSIPWTAVQMWAEAQGLDRASSALLHAALGHVENERIRMENAKARLNRATGGDR